MALSEELQRKYKPTIGIECHVQLKTRTKLFSGVSNDAREAEPNSLISHIDVGMPGALPVLNEKALELACRAAFALNTKPQKFSKFERKHYFYPDLPKGYQITQYEDPIIKGGYVELPNGQKVNINRVQLEEDAGKNVHPEGADYSLVDLNRAGTPLLEIVSEPEIHSATDAKAYARELYLIMKYADVSDVDLYHGNMRFDVNTSISASDKPGVRTEVKNLNSFRSVEAAIEYEIERQIELLEKGEKVIQETRGWDEAKQKTISQRGKEEAHDYRYMPEPDIPPIELSEEFIEKIKKGIPIMPSEWRSKLKSQNIDYQTIEILLDAQGDHPEVNYLDMLARFDTIESSKAAQILANLFTNVDVPLRNELKNLRTQSLEDMYSEILIKYTKGEIHSSHAKKLIAYLLESKYEEGTDDQSLVEDAIEKLGLKQLSDEGEIKKIVQEVLNENPKAAEDVKNGEMKAIGFLVGQVMAKSKGQANPGIAQKIIKKILGI